MPPLSSARNRRELRQHAEMCIRDRYYLTDAPAYILSRGGRVGACPTCTAEEMLGVNTVEQLAQVEELVRRREGLK